MISSHSLSAGPSRPVVQQQRRARIAGSTVIHRRRQCTVQASAGDSSSGAGGQTTTSGVQFPPFQTVSKGEVYDLRFYPLPYAVVEMDYRRRENGYLTLGQYQDGANATRTAFSFTQPVVMTYHPDGRKVMSLMVGAPRGGSSTNPPDPATLPAPTDPSVRLSVAGGEMVAVYRFGGYITPQTAEAARSTLVAALEKDGLKLAEAEKGGLFRVAQYGQVYTLEERLNELLLRIEL